MNREESIENLESEEEPIVKLPLSVLNTLCENNKKLKKENKTFFNHLVEREKKEIERIKSQKKLVQLKPLKIKVNMASWDNLRIYCSILST